MRTRPNRSGVQAGLALTTLIATSACQQHVALRAPDQAAGADARFASYEQLRPATINQTHTLQVRYGRVVGKTTHTNYLQLTDETRVYHAEDLLPIVPEASPTALAARKAADQRSTAYTLLGVGIAANVVGLSLVAGGLYATVGEDNAANKLLPYLITGGAITIAGTILNLVSGSYRRSANDETTTAFTTYDAALRQRLGVCLLNDQIISCPDGRLPRAP